MKAAVMTGIRRPFEIREEPVRIPGPGQVRVRIHASGLCGTDIHIWHGEYRPVEPPAILGHEPVGVIDAVGPDVTSLVEGDRVGVSWVQRGCGRCRSCAERREVYCPDAVTWAENGGGNAEWMIAEAWGCTRIPDGLSFEAAAPLFCAGYTVMSGYRNADPRPGDRVAVLGLGGLGHLALQVARALGHETVAVTNSADKAESLRAMGADEVLVVRHHPGRELRAIGGADIILATSNQMQQTSEALSGLRDEGRLVTMAVSDDPITVNPNLALGRQFVLKGSQQNHRRDLVEILDLAAAGKVRPAVEVYGLAQANQAFERLESGRVRFRAVLVPEGRA